MQVSGLSALLSEYLQQVGRFNFHNKVLNDQDYFFEIVGLSPYFVDVDWPLTILRLLVDFVIDDTPVF